MPALRFLIMAVVFLGGVVGTGLIGPNRSAIREAYGLSETAYGLGVAAAQVLSATGVLLAGPRLSRHSPVRIMMAALGVQVGGFLVISAWPAGSVAGLLVGWGFVQAGWAMAAVANNISMDLWPADPRRGVVLLHSFNAGGKVAGPLIAAACLGLGWRASFSAVGAVTLAAFLVFCVLRQRSEAAYVRGEGAALGWHVLRRGAYWFFIIAIGLVAGGEAAFVSLVPEYFEKVRGTSAETGTLLLTVHLLGLVSGRFAAALFAKRLSSHAVIAVCLASGACVLPVVLAESLAAVTVALFFLGLVFSATWPTFYVEASKWLAADRAMMPYGAALGNVLGISLCLLASGVLADANLSAALCFGPAVLWAFGLLYLGDALHRRARRARPG